ncbi:MAG: DUF5009 domain-containing protein [Selenomonas sp.]|nr:DUF5009 domain-containing protein [Selenomonas sp.]
MQIKAKKERLESLDVFRGLAIVCMIMVDAVPDFELAPFWMLHTEWQGISFADLAFPGFVFAMGAAGAIWLQKHERDWWPHVMSAVMHRAGILFLLGILYNVMPIIFQHILLPAASTASLWHDLWAHGRLFGVLQRLAMVYAVGIFLGRILQTKIDLLMASLFLLMVSSVGFHCFSPDAPFAQADNISSAIDQVIPGKAHCYMGAAFDPEGLYGTIAAAASMLLGLLAGRLLLERTPEGLLHLLGYGILMAGAGVLWNQFDIVSKPLWTAPYVLYTSSLFMILVMMLQALFSVLPRISSFFFHPFRVFGMNAILIYMLTGAALTLLWMLPSPENALFPQLWTMTVRGVNGVPFSIFLFTVLWCVCWWGLAEYLYRRRIFVKI